MAIHLNEYTETWVNDFFELAKGLVSALDGHGGQGIEHVGATAVPGLPARAIIDIAVIAAPLGLEEASEALIKQGYVPAKDTDQGRHFKAPNTKALHSLTVYEEDSRQLHALVATRNILMENEALAAEFAGYKRGIVKGAGIFGDLSVQEYQEAKAPMYAKILRAAGMSEAEIQAVASSFSA